MTATVPDRTSRHRVDRAAPAHPPRRTRTTPTRAPTRQHPAALRPAPFPHALPRLLSPVPRPAPAHPPRPPDVPRSVVLRC
ncbi:hypothetical protein GCM10009535_47830 [Streptomyces thermocarboxydovorans]|uniref:Uncharacterized protein n=1 Tax=Streptomyces thermocarboxydovorans TaxID=59298 RepID=A0ABN1HQ62_9ACTN